MSLLLIFTIASCSLNPKKEMWSLLNSLKGSDKLKNEESIKQQIDKNTDQKAFNIQVEVESVKYQVEVIEEMKVEALIAKLQNLYNKNINAIYFESSDKYRLLDSNFKLKNYQVKPGDYFEAIINNSDNKRATNLLNANDSKIDIKSYQGKKILVNSYHVSCKSFKPKKYISKENLGGIVLYSYDDKLDWKGANGVHCKTGYIIIKRIKDIEHLKSSYGIIHGKVYKSVFGADPDKKVVGSGFAFQNGNWKFNSGSFNARSDSFHTSDKKMNPVEEKYITKAIKNWIENGTRNLNVKENLAIFEVNKL